MLDVCNQWTLGPRTVAEFPVLTPLGIGVEGGFAGGEVVESRIDGFFWGWCGRTIFRLRNGQRWEQADFACLYHYAYAPRVRIYSIPDGYEMHVEGAPRATRVRRVR